MERARALTRNRWFLPLLAATGLLLAVAFFLLWEWHVRNFLAYDRALYPIDDADEWRYTACSRLVAHGYPLFTAVYSAQPPLLFEFLSLGTRFVSDSILGARLVEVTWGLIGLLAAAWLCFDLAGPIAAMGGAILLAVSPAYLVYSHAVEAEGPMMALSTLSLAVLARHYVRPRTGLPVLAGLLLAAAILTKFFALETFLPALWLLHMARESRRAFVKDSTLFVAAAAIPVALEFALVAPTQQWAQVVSLHQAAAGLTLPGTDPAYKVVWQFLTFDLGLSVMALSGVLALVVLRFYREAVFFVAWVAGSIIMLLYFQPLFPHHPAILLTGLACAAGVGIDAVLRPLSGPRLSWGRIVMAAAVFIYLVTVPRLAQADRHIVFSAPAPNTGLVSLIATHSTVGRLVAVDDLRLADAAHRLDVPPLCDPSNVRLRSGNLTGPEAITAIRRYRPKLVVSSFGIFQQVPGFTTWLASHSTPIRVERGVTAYEFR